MTVSNVNNRMDYTGDGTQDTYAYTYRIFDDGDLEVYRTSAGVTSELALTTDFSVDGAGDEDGGDIVLVAGDLTASDALVMLRVLPLTQPTSVRAFGPTFAAIEDALDRGIMIAQQLQEQIDRCVKTAVGSSSTGIELPAPVALDLIRWNAAEDGLENVDPSTLFDDVVMTGDFIVDIYRSASAQFTPGVTTQFTLSQAPGTENNLDLYFNGLLVDDADYTIAGTILTLSSAVPIGVTVVRAKQAHALPINVLGSATVPTAAVLDGAITNPKIGALAVDASKIALAAVGLPQIAAGLLQSGRNFLTDGSMMLADGADRAVSAGDAYGYGKANLWKGQLTVSGTGTLSRILTATIGRTGRALRWTVTAAGASQVTARTYIEAIDAIGLKNKTATLSLRGGHNAGANRNFTSNVYKANAVDDFSAVTAIRAGTPVAVVTDTDTLIAERAIAMGDCSNGVMVEIVIASGIVTAKTFDITEVVLELGTQETEYPFERFADVEARGAYYAEKLSYPTASAVVAMAQCVTTSAVEMVLYYRKKRIVPTITVANPTSLRVTPASGIAVAVTASGTPAAGTITKTACLGTLGVAGTPLVAGNASWVSTADATPYFFIDARF